MTTHENHPAAVGHSRPGRGGMIGATTGTVIGAVVLAHESGFTWDEALILLTPIVLIGGLLALARRRVRKQHEERQERQQHGE